MAFNEDRRLYTEGERKERGKKNKSQRMEVRYNIGLQRIENCGSVMSCRDGKLSSRFLSLGG